MKKIKYFFIFFVVLTTTFILASCGNNSLDEIDYSTALNYEQLLSIAQKPVYEKSYNRTNYSSSENTVIQDSAIKIPGFYSSILLNDATISFGASLQNPINNVAYNIDTLDKIINNTSLFVNSRNSLYTSASVYYSTSLPIVFFTNGNYFCITDCYLSTIYSRNIFNNNVIINNVETKTSNEITFIRISTSIKDYYFRYSLNNNFNTLAIESINEIDYVNSTNTNNSHDKYDYGLTPIYDSSNNLISYLYLNNSILYIYDNYKKYLNSIDISSLGFNFNYSIRLEKSILFYVNEEYVKNLNERSSKTSYKCRALEINLVSGKTYYNDDFKYYITNFNTFYDNKNLNKVYKAAIINYKNLNSQGELDDAIKSIIVKDELEFNSSFLYEDIKNVYILNDTQLLLEQNNNYYIVTKNERILLNGISNIRFIGENELIYKNQDGLYYETTISDFYTKYSNLIGGYSYITTNKINGNRLFCTYDSNKDAYICKSKSVLKEYLSFLNDNIFVTDNALYLGDVILYSGIGTNKISSISKLVTQGYASIYKINIFNGTTKYFFVSSLSEN